MGDQQQDRGLFSNLYNKVHGVSTESTHWDGSYGNNQNQNNNQGQNNNNQGQNYNQGQNHNQGQNNNQGQNFNQGNNQGQGHYQNPGSCQPPPYAGNTGSTPSQPGAYNPSAGMNPPAGGHHPPPAQVQNPSSNSGGQYNQGSGNSLTIGCTVALKNNNTGRYLSSQSVRYQGGSGQQQVTTNQWNVSDFDKWEVVAGFNQSGNNGNAINLNQTIRLKHRSTGCYLHSHSNINSPISQYQEVSCFGGGNSSDDNDNWILEKFTYNGGQENGVADMSSAFKLRHAKTGQYLFSHERTLQVNGATHAEVACYGNGNDESNKWVFQRA